MSGFYKSKGFTAVDKSKLNTTFTTVQANSAILWDSTLSYFTAISADATLDNTHEVVEVTGLSVITLPTAVGIMGRGYVIKNNSGVDISIDGYGAETIDGNLSISAANLEAYQLISNGTNWLVI